MIHQREIGVGHLGRLPLENVGDIDDVEQTELVQPAGDHVHQFFGGPVRGEIHRILLGDREFVAAQQRRRAAAEEQAHSFTPPKPICMRFEISSNRSN